MLAVPIPGVHSLTFYSLRKASGDRIPVVSVYQVHQRAERSRRPCSGDGRACAITHAKARYAQSARMVVAIIGKEALDEIINQMPFGVCDAQKPDIKTNATMVF